MQAENVRVSDTVLTGIITGILILGIALAYTFGGTYSMDWQVTEVSQDAEISEIKKQLVSLGFPAEILDDLRHEDILDCRGASRVAVDVHEHPVNDGRFVQETRKNADGYLSFHRTTVYDVKELVITGIAVELQGEREQWKIIHHFRWAEDPGYFGTESIQLWPAYRNGRSGWGKAGECTGRILYDKDGITYSAPYVHLGEETYTQSSFFWENSLSTDIFAEFSLPHSGENQRGYIAYTIKQMQEGMIVDAWINYTHQQTWLQYPALTAKQQRMANSWNDAGAFITVQDALQFYPTEEEVKVFG